MVKHYCDICGKEIVRNYVCTRLYGSVQPKGLDKSINLELIVGIGSTSRATGVWNNGDVCRECLSEAVNRAFDKGLKEGDGR